MPFSLDAGIPSLGDDEAGAYTLRDEAAQGAQPELVGPTWTLDTITDGDSASSVPAGVEATITFADDGTYPVAAGCNTGRGTYVRSGGGSYRVDAPALTRRRCDEDALAVEQAVVEMLDGEVSASIVGERLTIAATRGGDPDEDGARPGSSIGSWPVRASVAAVASRRHAPPHRPPHRPPRRPPGPRRPGRLRRR